MYYFRLQIFTQDERIESISRVLGIDANTLNAPGWCLEIRESDVRSDSNYVDYFLSILEQKYDELNKIGINADDISIWMLYEYDQQCNMELSPELMYKLGSRGITHCISCWEKGSIMYIEDQSNA